MWQYKVVEVLIEGLEFQLIRLGVDNWELVQFMHYGLNPPTIIAVFKRKVE